MTKEQKQNTAKNNAARNKAQLSAPPIGAAAAKKNKARARTNQAKARTNKAKAKKSPSEVSESTSKTSETPSAKRSIVSYETNAQPRIADIAAWRSNGASKALIANKLGISSATLRRWEQKHDDFKRAMDAADDRLFSRMLEEGHIGLRAKLTDKWVEETVMTAFEYDDEGRTTKRTETKRRFIPASDAAIIYTLKLRDPDNWGEDAIIRGSDTGDDGFAEAIKSEVRQIWKDQKDNDHDDIDVGGEEEKQPSKYATVAHLKSETGEKATTDGGA